MRRGALAALVAALAALCGPVPSAGAAPESLRLTEARSSGFPDRAYVLTLPESQTLPETSVTVTENGEPVEDLRVSALGGRAAVVLAIDTSKSMRRTIAEAMTAARAFAARRPADQKLGVVFFSRESRVVLEPTTDESKIDAVLGGVPPLTGGTRIFDAAETAIAAIERSKVPAGTVIVMSDGADYGSVRTPGEVVAHARREHVRLFGVGLESPSFDASSLKALATGGGVYVQARDDDKLAPIYAGLADRAGRDFLLSYRSRQPLESDIAVAVTVSGVRDTVTDAYRTPGFPVPPGLPAPPSWWESSTATSAIVVVIAILVGLGILVIVRPARASLSERLALFTGDSISLEDDARAARARALLEAADGRLSSSRRWRDFALDVELAKLPWKPGRIAMAAAAAAFLLAAGLSALGIYVVAAMAFIGVPLGTRLVIAHLAKRVRRKFEAQLPDNLQVLASALRAGHSFVGALGAMVRDAPEPSQKEFRRVVSDEQLGIPVEVSLEVVDDRMRCEDLVYVGLIATLSRDTGGNTAEVLDKVVETMRERAKIRRLVRTLTAQGRLGGWIITALPIGMVLFLNLAQPDYMDPMLSQTIGWVILVFAGMLVGLGAYCIRRIVDIKV